MPSRYLAESVVAGDGAVHIPSTVRKRFGVHAGDTLEWTVDGDALVLRVVRHRPGEKEPWNGQRAAFGTDLERSIDAVQVEERLVT